MAERRSGERRAGERRSGERRAARCRADHRHKARLHAEHPRAPRSRAARRSAVRRAVSGRAARRCPGIRRGGRPLLLARRAAPCWAARRYPACRRPASRCPGYRCPGYRRASRLLVPRRGRGFRSAARPEGNGPAGPAGGVPADASAAAEAASRPVVSAVARSRRPRRRAGGLTRPHHPPRPGNPRPGDRARGHSRGGRARAWADRMRHGLGQCRHVPPHTSRTSVSSRAAGHSALSLECRSTEIPCMT